MRGFVRTGTEELNRLVEKLGQRAGYYWRSSLDRGYLKSDAICLNYFQSKYNNLTYSPPDFYLTHGIKEYTLEEFIKELFPKEIKVDFSTLEVGDVFETESNREEYGKVILVKCLAHSLGPNALEPKTLRLWQIFSDWPCIKLTKTLKECL